MAQDIRKMMKERTEVGPKLNTGHEARFEARLAESFPKKQKNRSFVWMKIAAVGIVLIGLAYFGYQQLAVKDRIDTQVVDVETPQKEAAPQFTLGDISPDLKKIEEFYETGINVQLASLKITDENKEVIDGYMLRIRTLDEEYIRLNSEMNEVGPTEETVTALIDNLKLRLEMLFKLKNKLKELKNLENEQFNSYQS
ncbi:hypothetical protein [Ulvibacter antarcticus]|uniref:Uncharacterized protein n=1 Tax=Ulvibacter antarcticus TaxID=442714 RepID=A0A3L9YF08_9FLAO|nr:hypothetical protein [Ulvibacter antarcticus]RMA57940.1 hypothetical protein BXY75_2747 [Ulvibacter antarcticus]